MARVQLDLPDQFIFSCTLPVRASDLNYGAHVGNDSVLTLMQESWILFYRSRGFQSEISFDGTVGQIIADAVLVYKAEAFLGDTLTVHIAVANSNKYGFDMLYQLLNQNQKEVARGKTGIVCFDYEKRKVASIPENLRSALGL